MNHEEAVRLMASEKYLLQELAAELRDQFEEHLFGCQECALDVRTCAAFIEKAKTELAADSGPQQTVKVARPAPKWWAAWLRPAFAAPMALLLAVVIYQNAAISGLKHEVAENHVPAILASGSLINTDVRSGGPKVITAKRGGSFIVPFELPTDSDSSSYVAELLDPAGKPQGPFPISAEDAKDRIFLSVPGVQTAGRYTLVVHAVTPDGGVGAEIAHYPFELQLQSK